MMASRSRFLLPAALTTQAAILAPRIGLLPVWGDEQFTLTIVRVPISRMLDLLRQDVHPPLYFLFLKLWVWIMPWPATLIGKVRLASVCFTLLTTVAVDRLWLRDVSPRVRAWFVLLWVLSPFLMLYGRMGRSYTAQLLVAVIAIRYAVDWLRRPGMRTALRYALAQAALLYVHYAPGLALTASWAFHAVHRIARGERGYLRSAGVAVGVMGAVYLPWSGALAGSIAGRAGFQVNRLVPSTLLEHGIRIAYTFTSLTFGETLPLVGLVLAAGLTPVILWALVGGVRGRHEFLSLVGGTLPVGYALTVGTVVVVLTPSRLAFLLPFYLLILLLGCERQPRLARLAIPGVLVISLIAASSYYRQRDFLNKRYLLPFDTIAAEASASLADRGLFVVDVSNLDATPLLAALPPTVTAIAGVDDRTTEEIRRRIAQSAIARVWYLRNTHDVSRSGWSSRLARELGRSFQCAERHVYVLYGTTDRLAMRALGWAERPDYVMELMKCEAAGARGGVGPGTSGTDWHSVP
jgi:hypothetical protein